MTEFSIFMTSNTTLAVAAEMCAAAQCIDSSADCESALEEGEYCISWYIDDEDPDAFEATGTFIDQFRETIASLWYEGDYYSPAKFDRVIGMLDTAALSAGAEDDEEDDE